MVAVPVAACLAAGIATLASTAGFMLDADEAWQEDAGNYVWQGGILDAGSGARREPAFDSGNEMRQEGREPSSP